MNCATNQEYGLKGMQGSDSGGLVYVRPIFTKEEKLFLGKNVVVTGESSGIGYAIAKSCRKILKI